MSIEQQKFISPSVDNELKEKSSKEREQYIRSIEKNVPITDRSLEAYCDYFGLTIEEFRNKKILDLGSGEKEKFSKQVADKVNAEVYSLNPQLRRWQVRKKLKGFFIEDPKWQGKSVAGLGEELPFKDKSFDMITSLYGPLSYHDLKSQERFKMIQEMARALKPGGKIYIAPRGIGNKKPETLDKIIGKDSIQWLNDNGYEIALGKFGPIVITRNITTETDS